MALYDYRIASGANVALASLTNVEDLAAFRVNGTYYGLAPKTQPVNPFPVVTRLGSGRVRGDGQVDHLWTWAVLPQSALEQLIDDYLTTGGSVVKSKQVTIYTRLHDLDTYKRYNAWMVLPAPNEDYTYDRRFIRDLTLRFTDLRVLS